MAIADFQQHDLALWFSRHAPSPPSIPLLGPTRARLADKILTRETDAISQAQARYFDGDPQPLANLAARLVEELRVAVCAEARRLPLFPRLVGHIDRHMPTLREELMDDPNLAEGRRVHIIEDLDAMNIHLASYDRFFDAIEPLLGPTTTVLDLASGHGGFPLALARLARERGFRVSVVASDLRPEYVDVGRRRAENCGESDVTFRVLDAFRLHELLGSDAVDVVTCTQSLHHFGSAGVLRLITESLRVARRGVLLIDPVRTLLGATSLGLAAAVSTCNPWFVHDCVVSLRKSYVPEELGLIARCALGGEALEALYLSPGFAALRSGRAPEARS